MNPSAPASTSHTIWDFSSQIVRDVALREYSPFDADQFQQLPVLAIELHRIPAFTPDGVASIALKLMTQEQAIHNQESLADFDRGRHTEFKERSDDAPVDFAVVRNR